MAKSRKKQLKDKLWRLTSEYVRRSEAISRSEGTGHNLHDGQCITCGIIKPWKELQAGHFIPKAQGLSVYFDLRNIHTQCYRCNINLGGNGANYYPFMRDKYGEETIEELKRLSNTTVKFTESDYEKMIEDIKAKLDEL